MNRSDKYPSKEDVEKADAEQICRWNRFLPSPGSKAIGTPEFKETLRKESKIIDTIHTRMVKENLMTPEISKKIGWER